ncbi:MAG: hypothetical protein ABW104_01340 [Candidatus Thiodiazotropha sp. 6PLUC2]
MKALLNAAIELCLLKRGPQDLPLSIHLLWLTILLNMFVSVLMLTDGQSGLGRAIWQTLFELALMLGMLYTALRMRGLSQRFIQAVTALMLSGFLLGMLVLPLIAWGKQSQSVESGLLFLIVFSWGIVVFGHILRHTFDFSLNVGIAAALLYTMIAGSLIAIFFPVLD